MTGREDSDLVENRMEKNAGMYTRDCPESGHIGSCCQYDCFLCVSDMVKERDRGGKGWIYCTG